MNLLDSGGQASYARVLQKLDWYPDEIKRDEIVARDWRLGEILGFPEAIDRSVKALFEGPNPLSKLKKVPHPLSQRPEAPHPLHNAIPHSSLTFDIVDLILIASSYEEISPTLRFRDVYYSAKESNIAVSKLCGLVSPITTNVLHLVALKKKLTFNLSDDDGSWEETVDFFGQMTTAKNELQRRGNPPYDPHAYIRNEHFRPHSEISRSKSHPEPK